MSVVLCAGLAMAPAMQTLAQTEAVVAEGAEAQNAEAATQEMAAAESNATAAASNNASQNTDAAASTDASATPAANSNTAESPQQETSKQETVKQESAKNDSSKQETTKQETTETTADAETAADADPATAKTYIVNQSCTDAELNAWFSDAGFVGNSIGVGLASYIKRQGDGYLGNPKLMVKGSYSFLNDGKSNPKYRIDYAGFNGPAREVVAKSGVKKVFINMGTNDLWEAPSKAYQRYVDYIQGIQKSSPGILVFIEATTGVAPGHENRGLSNKNVNELNSLIKNYCAGQKNVYYIDINSPMMENGALKTSLSSDKDVHLTNSAYKIWMNTVIRYVDNKLSNGTLK